MNDEQQIIEPVPTMSGYKKIPTFKLWIANQFPYIETDFDAITNYELLQAVIKYLNTIIENENNVESNVTALYNAFVNLHDYVETFFENLDVQEEVNNKLDKMVEDGTIESILLNYSQLTKVYNTFNDMMLDASTFVNGMKLKTLGYHYINDGGGADYVVTNVQSNSKYQVSIGTNLWVELIGNSLLNIQQFGTFADGTHDDTTAIQTALNYAILYNLPVYFNKKTYLITHLSVSNPIIINGNNAILKCSNSNDYVLKIENNALDNTIINNLEIDGNNNDCDGLLIYTHNWKDTYSIFNNIEVYNCLKNGIKITGDYSNTSIRELKLINCNEHHNLNGIYSDSMSDSYIINNTAHGNKHHGIYLYKNATIKISNSKCYMNGKGLNEILPLNRIPASAFNLTSDTTPITGKKYYTRSGNGNWQNPYSFTLFTGTSFVSGTDYYELTGNYLLHGHGIYLSDCNSVSMNNVEVQGNAGDGINCYHSNNLDFTNIIAHINGYLWDNDYNPIKYETVGLQCFYYGVYLDACNFVNISGNFFNEDVVNLGYIQRSSVLIKGVNNIYLNLITRVLVSNIEYSNIDLKHFNAIINGQAISIPIALNNINLVSTDYSFVNNDFNGSYIYVKNGIAYFKLVIENANMPVNTTTNIGTISIIKPLLQEIFKGIASTTYIDSVIADATLLIDKGGNIKIRNNENGIKYLSFSGNFIF